MNSIDYAKRILDKIMYKAEKTKLHVRKLQISFVCHFINTDSNRSVSLLWPSTIILLNTLLTY